MQVLIQSKSYYMQSRPKRLIWLYLVAWTVKIMVVQMDTLLKDG